MQYKCPIHGIIPKSWVRDWGKLICLACYKGGDINTHRDQAVENKIVEVLYE